MTTQPNPNAAALMGALVADAATLGTHWIYDPARIASISGNSPVFVPINAQNYDGVPAYFAHATRKDGDQSQYGEVLDAAENQNGPRILNYRGFTNRKLGNHAVAMEFYEAALSIDPNYILARSYMAQGLLAYGDEDGARVQLAEIRERGGRNTWSYTALQMALRGTPSKY